LLKSNNNQLKYETAVSLFNKASYNKAMQLFEQITPEYKGTDKAEKIAYMNAYCYYHEGDYILANYQFKQFADNFPTSQYAEECAYMSAYCKYLDSPIYSLDQTNTVDAMKELQVFINRYPQSSRVEQSNELIDKLRDKLELKEFEIGNLFYKTSDLQAAIVTYNNLLKEYPDTRYREDALYMLLKAYKQYAEKSIESKLAERYGQVYETCDKILQDFPKSKYTKEVTLAQAEAAKYIKK
ncbi:MAG: outer membrane protein assembly factor BamD, partial [Bacteroidota bacterium]|nr:outer membrane protein assembly factor BamD [Bacteroidota bacterium]